MAENYTLHWLAEYDNVLHVIMLPHEPDWQVTEDALDQARQMIAGRAPETCTLIFDISANPNPPDMNIITKGQEFLRNWPSNVGPSYVVGMPMYARFMFDTLKRILRMPITVVDSLDDALRNFPDHT